MYMQVQRSSETVMTFIPFHRLYTPSDIRSSAEFTSTNYSYTPIALTFGTDSLSYKRRLFKLPLLPANLLNSNSDITVMITVGLKNSIRVSGDSDPKLFISDGVRGIGFDLRDGIPRCHGMQALMGDIMNSITFFSSPSAQSTILSEKYTFIISPSQLWGSCHFAGDNGLVSPVSYTQIISLHQGLWLEMYRDDASEQYIVNYITVEIHEN